MKFHVDYFQNETNTLLTIFKSSNYLILKFN
ncbi:hypothetical protein EMGBS15_13350 [Filimonas sp.]|nr:hypothetical protein EMGBS15_13350 [Filimonas sp.]